MGRNGSSHEGDRANARRPVPGRGALRVEILTAGRREASVLQREVGSLLPVLGRQDPLLEAVEEIVGGQARETKLSQELAQFLKDWRDAEGRPPELPLSEALHRKVEASLAASAASAGLVIHPQEGNGPQRVEIFRPNGKKLPLELMLFADGGIEGEKGLNWLVAHLGLGQVRGRRGPVVPKKQLAMAVRTALARGGGIADGDRVEEAGLVSLVLDKRGHRFEVFLPGDEVDPVLEGDWPW